MQVFGVAKLLSIIIVAEQLVPCHPIIKGCVVVVAVNDSEYDNWVKGLTYLIDDTARSSYSLLVQRYFASDCFQCRVLHGNAFMIPFSSRSRVFSRLHPIATNVIPILVPFSRSHPVSAGYLVT